VNERLFVYGTLLPDQPQWALLRRYVTDHGWDTAVAGRLFDTGHGYPVADFEPARLTVSAPATDQVIGRAFTLLHTTSQVALTALDSYEEVDRGLYRRALVTTIDGTRCWAYCLGAHATDHFERLEPIESGDWIRHLREKI
jgi:gamma-glutamylcyclotransferase (GGCT)/AIG2-like uncharacterized protein YtfP